jgi:sugar lactone lactonase YvrE
MTPTRSPRAGLASLASASVALALAVAPAAQAQPRDAAMDALPRALVPAETLAELPNGTFLENLVAPAEGTVWITSYFARELLEYKDGAGLSVKLSLSGHPVSLAADTDGTYAIVVHGRSFRDGPEFFKTNQVWRWSPGYAPEPWVAAPDAKFLNGLARIAPGVFLVADSLAGTIWRVDLTARRIDPWLVDAALESTAPQQMRPGANGIRLHGGTVLVSNSTRRTIVEVPLLADGRAGPPRVRAVDVPTDDFAVRADGTIYATTHRDYVVRIAPDDGRAIVAEHAAVKGSASAVFGVGPSDADALYVVGDGGLFFGSKAPATLVRLRTGAKAN